MLKTGFIGAGTVGTALAILLSEKGYRFVGASRKTKVTAASVSSNSNLPDRCNPFT